MPVPLTERQPSRSTYNTRVQELGVKIHCQHEGRWGVFVNTKLARKGVDPDSSPQTLEDLAEAWKKMTTFDKKGEIDVLGGDLTDLPVAVARFLGRLVADDGATITANSAEVASSGWSADARAARCEIDEHDGCLDLWLEEVHQIPVGLDECRRAVVGLAHWQVAHQDANESWLATNWIATHVSRQAVDNEQTLTHPAWHSLPERGLNPGLRDWVKTRVTTSAAISGQLAALPQMLTHHDFHEHNIGTVDGEVVIIDWAYVGWGPVGHDVGHLALSLAQSGGVDLADVWALLEQEYCDALSHAGWSGDLEAVRRSMRVSNQLRMGWVIDYLLVHADRLPDQLVRTVSANLSWLYDRT